MTCIVCATRGGEGSRVAKHYASDLARRRGLPLILLLVVDPDSLEGSSPSLRDALSAELRWTGQALLSLSHARAAARGILAEAELREGRVPEEIERVLSERQAACLVLGAPRGTTANVFGDDEIEGFAESIESRTGVEVRIIRPEQQVPRPE